MVLPPAKKETIKMMFEGLSPLKSESLKDNCIRRFEGMILSGAVSVDEKLPPERELAGRLGVSRPVVHEALVDLAVKGLVSMTPRKGTVVNDFRRQGSVTLLTSLLEYQNGRLDARLLDGLLNMRMLIETENARLAAENRTPAQVDELNDLILQESGTDSADGDAVTRLDFEFHLLLAIATDNLLYPLLLNSFKPVYTNLSGQFFKDSALVRAVFDFHKNLAAAIADQDEHQAAELMRRMLLHGEDRLRKIISINA
ncbi:MAG: FadR/GntR family transcriptional regulator [Desulfobacteraceae bacterium]|nr:FadR/GntR family transcriptional regulator [Desulfobacteraceae bacterium]